jgi:hypothetical protein
LFVSVRGNDLLTNIRFRSRLCENPRNWYPIRCRAGRIVALRFSEVGCSHVTIRRRPEPVAELPSAREC